MKTFVGPIERQKFLEKVKVKLRRFNAIFLVFALLPVFIYSAFELRIIKTAQPKTETGFEGIALLRTPGENLIYGTAFLINENQLITAAHCVEYVDKGDEVGLKFYNDEDEYVAILRYKGDYDSYNPNKDYAILEILDVSFENFYELKELGNVTSLNQEIIVAGFPAGKTFQSSSGEITGSFTFSNRAITHQDDDELYQLQFDGWGGMSGAPIIDKKTELVLGIYVAEFNEKSKLEGMQVGVNIDNFLADPNVQKIINAKEK